MSPQRMSHTTRTRGDPFLTAVAEAQLALARTSAALWVAAFRLMAPRRLGRSIPAPRW